MWAGGTTSSIRRNGEIEDKGTDSPPRQIHPQRYYAAMATDEDVQPPLPYPLLIPTLSPSGRGEGVAAEWWGGTAGFSRL